jgi:hypothetical protein
VKTHTFFACLMALAVSSCALAPEFKAFYLSHKDWRGTALSGHGRLVVADAAAGAAPLTVTLIEIGGVQELPADPVRRLGILDQRVEAVTAELERRGIAGADIGVDFREVAEGTDREPPWPLLAKRMVIVVHEY